MLIKDLATDKHSYKIVQSVVPFAKALEIKTIAEYVATKEIFDIVYLKTSRKPRSLKRG